LCLLMDSIMVQGAWSCNIDTDTPLCSSPVSLLDCAFFPALVHVKNAHRSRGTLRSDRVRHHIAVNADADGRGELKLWDRLKVGRTDGTKETSFWSRDECFLITRRHTERERERKSHKRRDTNRTFDSDDDERRRQTVAYIFGSC